MHVQSEPLKKSASALGLTVLLLTGCQQSSSSAENVAARHYAVSSPLSSSSEHVRWTTYDNAEFGFRFEYPAAWFLKEERVGTIAPSRAIMVRVSNVEWNDNPYSFFDRQDAAMVYVFAATDVSDGVREEFGRATKNAVIDGEPATKTTRAEGERTDAGSVPRAESGISFRTIKGSVDYIAASTPLDTPVHTTLEQVLASLRFTHP